MSSEDGTRDVLRQLVADNLALYLYDNAIFYAERLFAAEPTTSSLHTLAEVHMLKGDVEGAVRLLRGNLPLFCGETGPITTKLFYLYGVVLARTNRFQEADHAFRSMRGDLTPAEQSALLYWMGVIQRKTNRDNEAGTAFLKSVQSNPLNWGAIENAVVLNTHSEVNLGVLFSEKVCSSLVKVPRAAGTPAKKRMATPLGTPPHTQGDHPVPLIPGASQPPRVAEESSDALQSLLVLLRHMLGIISASARYLCHEVVLRIKKLPQAHRDTGYVQGILAKAYYDEGLYQEACTAFDHLRSLEPYKLDPKLVYYSSCLWQLQQDKRLAYLAQEMIQMDKLSVVTQVVLGNTHSIVGEHETAAQFFARACNIDKHYAYSHTLRGMEHLVMEELDDAAQAFRVSLRLDSRNYPAWHGLGSVAVKKELWQEASLHFKKACTINPSPPLLLAYANSLMEERHPSCLEYALTTIERVLQKQPTHPLATLRKGEILLKCGQLEKAKAVAHGLLERAPREAKVNLLLGRIYRKVGDRVRALQYLNLAHGLDPKDTPAVKAEIERFHEGEDSGEDEWNP
ncbi:Cell division cycle protein 27-like protein B [Diplonema papillatum]|nr:Cell division cycle protein 27-like protein B [Diplonema papillatum]